MQSWSVTANRVGNRFLGVLLTLVLVVAVAGLPVPVEAEHDGDVTHVAPPHVGHGVALVGQELQLKQSVLPDFLPEVARIDIPTAPAVGTTPIRKLRIDAKNGRAPPNRLPRAPPA